MKIVFTVGLIMLVCVPFIVLGGMIADWNNADLAAQWDGFNHLSSALISYTLAAVSMFCLRSLPKVRQWSLAGVVLLSFGIALLYQLISEGGGFAVMGQADVLDVLFGVLASVPGMVLGWMVSLVLRQRKA